MANIAQNRDILRTLESMGVRARSYLNGSLAWDHLCELARRSSDTGRPISELVSVIITDV